MTPSIKAALIIVDLQEDFCPPKGSLAVTDGRSIAPVINDLLKLPWTLRVATKDMHPKDHISFASQHPPPNNKPFESSITIANPHNLEETQTTNLWPDHCVAGSPGSELIPELDVSRLDEVVEKGQDKRVEMYSAFCTPFLNPKIVETGLAKTLKEKGVTHVFCVGLAADFCVKATAIDAAKEGFETVVIREGTKGVEQGDEADKKLAQELKENNVKMVSVDGPEVAKVRDLQ
ncbi:Isochorismatase hydrolase [Aureobasidium pullulans]|uniref:nicotinamidase n=1 Tax=Aureobasidium pullulans TaxID=5580 RepID=A0A4S9YC19_AURPU|nr:Isochorismatase hydrolase [Aureobasidium pullulans]THZ35980.1 Isochorismatase hydrolase [Aureobasidium pullulans]THZ56127.1 Isochorismatase hydrolase [Aureobasidium pullulans]THZ89647.1 Isochorismatase hydrolase [Aureobasidium pullulans]